MKIRVDDIPDDGLALELKEEPEALKGLIHGEFDFSLLAPVEGHLELRKTDGNVFATGDLTARLKLNCGRCLKEFEYDLRKDFAELFVAEKEEAKEKELKVADMEVDYLEGGELDTTELVLGQLSLDVPIQPLCKEDCKGLCQKCGADLNLGECGCPKEEKMDSSFAKLKDFKVK